jgi:predicted esterase
MGFAIEEGMKWFLGILLLSSFFAQMSFAKDQVCSPTKFSYKLNKRVTVKTDYYPAFDPQGAVVFIEGPEGKYQSARSFVNNLCQRGFSIAAFNLEGKDLKPRDYLRAADYVTKKLKKAAPRTPLIAYGWSKGAGVAVDLVQRHSRKFRRVILESPVLTSTQTYELMHQNKRLTRVFACAQDSLESLKLLKKYSKRTKVFLTQSESCSHHLATSGEVKGPLVDFIEGDFASGFTIHDNGFWQQL